MKKELILSKFAHMQHYFDWNCSSLFLVKPITGLTLSELSNVGFIRSFIYYNKEGLFLLFKNTAELNSLIYTIKKNKAFQEEINFSEHTLLCFIIPIEYENDFALFKLGKYSKFSKFLKKQYSKFIDIGNEEVKSFQWKIFDKDENFKESMEEYIEATLDNTSEIYTLPNMEKETFTLNYINYEPKAVS